MVSSSVPVKLSETPPIVVIGMHRSGTSLLARILSDLGVHMGDELEANHEAVTFLKANNELLKSAGAYWAKPRPFLSQLEDESFLSRCEHRARESLGKHFASYGDASRMREWGWKDPRNTLTLPVWRRCFPAASVIHVVRNGLDVALSLFRRERRRWINKGAEKRMFPPTLGASYRLWKTYTEAGLLHAGRDSLRLRYEDLIGDPEGSLAQIAELAGLRPNRERLEEIVRTRIRSPSPKNRWQMLRLRLLLKTGLLDPGPLEDLGYELP